MKIHYVDKEGASHFVEDVGIVHIKEGEQEIVRVTNPIFDKYHVSIDEGKVEVKVDKSDSE